MAEFRHCLRKLPCSRWPLSCRYVLRHIFSFYQVETAIFCTQPRLNIIHSSLSCRKVGWRDEGRFLEWWLKSCVQFFLFLIFGNLNNLSRFTILRRPMICSRKNLICCFKKFQKIVLLCLSLNCLFNLFKRSLESMNSPSLKRKLPQLRILKI